jgi:hypothetical protein
MGKTEGHSKKEAHALKIVELIALIFSLVHRPGGKASPRDLL